MNILFVSATPFEIAPLRKFVEESFVPFEKDQFQRGEARVTFLVTGVGLALAAFALGKMLARQRFDLVIQAGLAGSFDRNLALGNVVQVVSEQFGDLGVEEKDGSFTDVHELGLIPPDQAPFRKGVLYNDAVAGFDFLPKVSGLSVQKVHGFPPSIQKIKEKYKADVESMEGASFFYACLLAQQPFLQIRAISNYVEARDRSAWKIPEAIEALNKVLQDMLSSLAF